MLHVFLSPVLFCPACWETEAQGPGPEPEIRPCGWSTRDSVQSAEGSPSLLKTRAVLKRSALLPLGRSVLLWCFSVRAITASPMRLALKRECSFGTIEFSLHLLIPRPCGLWLLWKARAQGEDSLLSTWWSPILPPAVGQT